MKFVFSLMAYPCFRTTTIPVLGPGTDPSRVIKGKKMPGHYGAERHPQTNLRVEKIDADRNLIYLRGAVAGPINGIVLVRKQGPNG